MSRQVSVAFSDENVRQAFEDLKRGRFESKELCKFIMRAIGDIKQNPSVGISIPKRLIPPVYIKKYGIDNLWKYNLPGAWRLLYTIKADQINIVAIILEWLPHKEYERRFGY